MPLYTVFAPPPKPGQTAPDPVRFVFVKDGFCWPALFIPELWLLFRRMWLVFAVYLAASVVLSVAGARFGGPLPYVALALMHLLFALEANALRRWKLAAAGYAFLGVAEGGRAEAELRFFSQWQAAALPPAPAAPAAGGDGGQTPPAETPAAAKTQEPAKAAAESGEVVGLFPVPGGAS